MTENRQDAEYLFLGEGLAADSGRYRNFSSSTARLELNLYKGKQLLLSDRQKETVAGASYVIAAKDALAQGCLNLARRMLPALK